MGKRGPVGETAVGPVEGGALDPCGGRKFLPRHLGITSVGRTTKYVVTHFLVSISNMLGSASYAAILSPE